MFPSLLSSEEIVYREGDGENEEQAGREKDPELGDKNKVSSGI